MDFETLFQKLPGVVHPTQKLTFKEKLKWTLLGLVLYYILSQIFIWGVMPEQVSRWQNVEDLLGASFGTIITLGIGPIVTSSIMLQLMVGAGIIGWDLSTHHGKVMFQGSQKLLAMALCVIEAVMYAVMGAIQPVDWAPFTIGMIILQLALGGLIIMLLDEVISKWGFGSGVSLFIAAGVAKRIMIQLLSPLVVGTLPVGRLPAFFVTISQGAPDFTLLIPIISTVLVFVMVVYAQSMKVEIPLAFGSVRGFGRKWPLRFIYTSNMPVILAATLLINLQVWSKLLADRGFTLFGTFSTDGAAQSGLMYYLTPPNGFLLNLIHLNVMGSELARVIAYSTFMVVSCIVFAVFWVNTSGMDAKSVSEQIQKSGMQIPGFRRDSRIVERILSRYIPYLSVLGGAFVGLLAAFADFTGSMAEGTGILLTVMIVYQLYEEIAIRHLEDMHPMLRKYIQK